MLLRRLVTCISVIAAIGITQFATGFNLANFVVIPGLTRQIAFVDLLTRDGINRPSATTAHPLEFAAVLGLALPLALHQARFARPGTRFRRWLQVALIATALPLTVSRSVVLGLVIIACVLMPTWPARQLRIAYPALAGGLVALWVVEPRLISLIYQLFSKQALNPAACPAWTRTPRPGRSSPSIRGWDRDSGPSCPRRTSSSTTST